MNIKVSQKIPFINTYKNITPTFVPQQRTSYSDVFIRSEKANQLSFKGDSSAHKNKFAIDLSRGLKEVMDCDIPPENLKSIMTPEEFRKELPNFKTHNFLATPYNQDEGIYCVDLDYQTRFSSGNEHVFEILDNVAEYANSYHEKTGKNFIFAITDRDGIEGLQHVIRLIGTEPEKYKHLKLVPGIKMSFAHKAPNSGLGYENSDMLVYGINPFSKNLIDFMDDTVDRRKKMIVDFIRKVKELYPEFAYSVLEFTQQNRIKYKKGFCVSNLYWRAREYAETKGDTAIKSIDMAPETIIREADEILNELDQIFLGSTPKSYSALGSEIIKDEEVNQSIKEVFEEYSTHYDEEQGKDVSVAENLYDEMIECLSKEPYEPTLAVCAPYYFSHYYKTDNTDEDTFDEVVDFIKELQANSNGYLVAFESVVPSYDLDINLSMDKINKFNKYIKDNTDLYEVGGSFAKRNQ